MIYCSLDPGLLILEGLSPHEVDKAKSVINSLILHNRKMEQCGALIPMTNQMIQRVYKSLDKIQITNPPILSPLRGQIISMLNRMAQPPLGPANLPGMIVIPDITSSWISQDIKDLWFDCLTSSLFEKQTKEEIELAISTWQRENVPFFVVISNPNLDDLLSIDNGSMQIPVMVNEKDWDEFICALRGWPIGLDSVLIESYGRRSLGIPIDALSLRRGVEFEAPCYRDICHEQDTQIQCSIIEVVACRVYNRLRPDHHDEILESGEHRIYVRKMAPPVRLHYILRENSIVFTLYSNGEHDRGL